MTNRITKPLEEIAGKTVKVLAKDAGKAVKNLYHDTGKRLKQDADAHLENDKKIATDLKNIGSRDDPTPVYHIDDDGNITRLHHDPTATDPANRYRHDDLTPDDINRLGLDDTSIGRPKRGERNASLKNNKEGGTKPRPQTQSEEIPLGSTDLARATQLGRHADNSYGPLNVPDDAPFSSNNYAAARVAGANGHGDFILVSRSNGYRHSERMIGIPFLRKGEPSRITEIYTEREPCGDKANCSAWLAERFKGSNVKVSHSVEYGDDASKARGSEVMKTYLDQLRKSR